MALARTDAGVEISLNPTSMVRKNGKSPVLGRGQVLRPWAHGAFTRSAVVLAQRDGAPAAPNGDGTAAAQPADGRTGLTNAVIEPVGTRSA